MALKALVENKPREQAGSQTFRAYDYQVHASMARILDAFTKGEPFSAFFDLFDDLIFVEEGPEQTTITFYQVKARANSAWTSSRLAFRSAKGQSPKSIVGKSYHNLHQFGDLVWKAAITSNQLLQATYKDGSSTSIDDGEILLSSLSTKDHETLVAAMLLDYPGGLDPRHAEVLTFQRIPLDMHSFRQTLLGLVTEFMLQLGSEYTIAAKPLYDALLSEITRCTGAVANAASLAELKAHKGLCTADLQALVDRVQKRQATPMEWWGSFELELVAEGRKSVPIYKLKMAALDYWRARERGSASTLDLSAEIKAHLAAQAQNMSDSLTENLTMLLVSWVGTVPQGETYTLEAGLLVEMMDALT